MIKRPKPSEYEAFYSTYIDKVPDGDVIEILGRGADETAALLRGEPEELGDYRYAPGKWTVREVIAHLADNWPKNRASRGYLSVLDADLRVVSNIAGTPPVYDDAGKLQPMRHHEDVFIHPHDLLVDTDESIYIAQFASEKTYPIKLERV